MLQRLNAWRTGRSMGSTIGCFRLMYRLIAAVFWCVRSGCAAQFLGICRVQLAASSMFVLLLGDVIRLQKQFENDTGNWIPPYPDGDSTRRMSGIRICWGMTNFRIWLSDAFLFSLPQRPITSSTKLSRTIASQDRALASQFSSWPTMAQSRPPLGCRDLLSD